MKALITTIDQEFENLEKARVKPFTRTRRGRMERVKGFERKHSSFTKLKVGDTVTDTTGDKFEILEIDKKGRRAFVKDKQSPKDKFWLEAEYINKPHLLAEPSEYQKKHELPPPKKGLAYFSGMAPKEIEDALIEDHSDELVSLHQTGRYGKMGRNGAMMAVMDFLKKKGTDPENIDVDRVVDNIFWSRS